jgi:8-oxo-dGTP pyrophosphatase MutT (NUDIX family)
MENSPDPNSSNKVLSAVHAIIQYNDKFLVIKQVVTENHTYWDIPGGKVMHLETPYEALRREVKEEVGLNIEVFEPLGMWWFFRVNDGDQIVSTVFRCTTNSFDVNLHNNPSTENIADYRWVTPAEYASDEYQASDPSLKQLIASSLKI